MDYFPLVESSIRKYLWQAPWIRFYLASSPNPPFVRGKKKTELNAKNDYLDPGRLRDLQRSVVMSRARPSSTRITRSVNGRVFCNARLSRRRLLVCTWILYRDKNLFAFSPLERLRRFFYFFLSFLLTRMHANVERVTTTRRVTRSFDAPRHYESAISFISLELSLLHARRYVRTYVRGPLCRRSPFRSEISFHREKKRGCQLCDVTRRPISFWERST